MLSRVRNAFATVVESNLVANKIIRAFEHLRFGFNSSYRNNLLTRRSRDSLRPTTLPKHQNLLGVMKNRSIEASSYRPPYDMRDEDRHDRPERKRDDPLEGRRKEKRAKSEASTRVEKRSNAPTASSKPHHQPTRRMREEPSVHDYNSIRRARMDTVSPARLAQNLLKSMHVADAPCQFSSDIIRKQPGSWFVKHFPVGPNGYWRIHIETSLGNLKDIRLNKAFSIEHCHCSGHDHLLPDSTEIANLKRVCKLPKSV